jgi:hypothetical protein
MPDSRQSNASEAREGRRPSTPGALDSPLAHGRAPRFGVRPPSAAVDGPLPTDGVTGIT